MNFTVGEVYRHLNIKEMVIKAEDREGAGASISSIEDLDSPFSDSPFFADSPRVLDSPLVNPMDHLLVHTSSSSAGGIKITVSSSGDNPAAKEEGGKKAEGVNISPVSSVGVSASILKVKTELRDADENAPHRKNMINSLQILGLVSLIDAPEIL